MAFVVVSAPREDRRALGDDEPAAVANDADRRKAGNIAVGNRQAALPLGERSQPGAEHDADARREAREARAHDIDGGLNVRVAHPFRLFARHRMRGEELPHRVRGIKVARGRAQGG